MCIALPMKVTAVNGTTVHCERTGRAETADASMVVGLIPGDFVLVFRNEVIRRIDETEAHQIEAALACVRTVSFIRDSFRPHERRFRRHGCRPAPNT